VKDVNGHKRILAATATSAGLRGASEGCGSSTLDALGAHVIR
jgi:hypothetical protein